MRRFHSYGPVDCEQHFCVARRTLVEQCTAQLIGHPEKGGHYFTIWAPRQTGKTWLMRQSRQDITTRYEEQFVVYDFSLGRLRGMDDVPPEGSGTFDLPRAFRAILQDELPGKPVIEDWRDFYKLFSKDGGLWDRPLILFIDEVDTIPSALIDLMVAQFRELHLRRETNWLHGLALVGVRAVLGIESERGSPFNIQRSLHVPNLTVEEVRDLFQQYQEESGQPIVSEVVDSVYTVTHGQPGLVSWFGELLTEKYNPGKDRVIDRHTWDYVYSRACYAEFNNTVLNIIKKAKTEYRQHVLELFSRADARFSLDADWCNYMYLHGLIDEEMVESVAGLPESMCRFSSPFIQLRIYNALTYDLFESHSPILALEPLDDLAEVFHGTRLNVSALIQRYKDYLARLKAKGINPWKDQPRRRTDLHLTEAVGHFHLYAWLQEAVGRQCVVSPEFPTGNGKVDIHVKCGSQQGIIEVKSFAGLYQNKNDRVQAARYAKSLGVEAVTLAVFIPVEDETVLTKLSGEETIEGVQVSVAAISWV